MTVIKYSSGGSQLWVRSYNSTINGDDEALAIAVDRNLNVYITGFVTLVNTDIYTIKFNSSGTPQWNRFIQGTAVEDDKAYAITIDNLDNIYVGGYTTNDSTGADFTLIKYTSGGVRKWIGYYDGPAHSDDIAVCMTLSEGNRIYLAGWSKSDTTASTEDYMTVRFNPESGDTVWTRRYNGSGNGEDKVYAITIDKLDNIYITGYVTVESLTGGIHSSNLNYMTFKYDSDGNILWETPYDSGSNNEIANALFVSNSGEYLFVTGSTRKGNDPDSQNIATVKYNILTGIQMQASIIDGRGKGEDIAYGVYADSADNIYLAGYMKNLTTGLDMFSSKYHGGDLIEVKNISTEVPRNFALYQNYPNPFNPSTLIKFDVIVSGHIKLVIYDILGRNVETLINENLKYGSYEVTYNALNLSSGLYFYELTTNNFRDVKKMILIK
jgi:hypothetical protein